MLFANSQIEMKTKSNLYRTSLVGLPSVSITQDKCRLWAPGPRKVVCGVNQIKARVSVLTAFLVISPEGVNCLWNHLMYKSRFGDNSHRTDRASKTNAAKSNDRICDRARTQQILSCRGLGLLYAASFRVFRELRRARGFNPEYGKPGA